MVTGRLTRLAKSGYGRTQSFGGDGIAKAFGNAEMGFACAFFHPGCNNLDGRAQRMGFRFRKAVEERQAFEVAPRRKDDLDLAGIRRVDNLLRTRPKAADILGVVDHGLGRVVAHAGKVEARIEHACFAVRRAPARERDERIEIQCQPGFREKRAERLARVKPGLCRRDPFGQRVIRKANGNAAFLKRFADRRNPSRALIGFMRMGRRDGMIVGVDSAARKDDRATRKGHAGRTLDHQQFGRPGHAMPEDYEGCRRDRGRPLILLFSRVVIHPEGPKLDPAFGKGAKMGIMEVLGVAGSVSLLAGWRLYLCIFATGLAMRLGWIAPPEHLQSLAVLANNWVMGAAGLGMIAEFFADKIAWLDSLWDAVHTAIRPVGGALLALALVDASDPKWQVITLLLGGGAALVSHGAKAGTRAVINASPEPFSNIAVSTGEDVATGGLLFLALSNPIAAIFVAILVAAVAIAALVMVRRVLKKLFGVAEEPSITP